MSKGFRELDKIIAVKPEPETTPSLAKLIQQGKAAQTVSQYYFTPSLRAHFKRIFDCVVNAKGQGFWIQAEYGAGKTHFQGTLIDLLVWKADEVWCSLTDEELKHDYHDALEKVKLFPVAFSLRGMGESDGHDSLMRVFEDQIRASIKAFAPQLDAQIKLTSVELADEWYQNEASEDEKAAIRSFFAREHKSVPEDFRSANGPKKFGQELVRSKIPEGRLKGRYKDRFAHIYEQITKLGGYTGIIFVVDEFRFWQDRHVPGTVESAEDEEILETLAFVLPSEHYNVLTLVASQGDMPQKLSGGAEGDRFVPLYLLADKNKGDFGEIVSFRCRELVKGASSDIKDYYDYCRKEYRFIKQANISLEYFTAIFPFQPRCFEVMRRITQNAEQHNLPTARSAIRMAWQTLSDAALLKGTRLITLSDIIRSDELRKGLTHEHYREAYQNLLGSLDQLPQVDLAPEERAQAERVMETLFLWGISLPENLRDGLTAQEVAEAAWLSDDAVGSTAQAEMLLGKLVQNGFPLRQDKKTRDGKEVAVFSYEGSAAQETPAKYFAPLKKKAKEDLKGQDAKWLDSLFWQLPDITPEAQAELGVNGGIFSDYRPNDQRSAQDRQQNKPPAYLLPHHAAASTGRVHRVRYGGEVVISDRWRDEFGEEIKNADQHFRLVYLTAKPGVADNKITADLADARVAVCLPDALSNDSREALADLMAAEQMKRNCAAPNQSTLREYADGKRRDAVKAILKCQQDEYRRGKVITQKGYGILALEIFKLIKDREDDLAGRLLDKSYDTPLFDPKGLKKEFTDADARKVYAGLFQKEPAKAEKDAVQNFAVGLELVAKTHPTDFKPDTSQALGKLRDHLQGQADVPLSDLKAAFCRAPYGLTEAMVSLYALAQVKVGGYEVVLNPGSPITMTNGKALPGNRLTPHTLALCEWNAKLDKAMLGARIVKSIQKGWNEVLDYARVLDPDFKPASSPDEELTRNDKLLTVLAKLKGELPDVEKSLTSLLSKLGSAMPKELTETLARLNGLVTVGSYQEFDAAVRESYANKDAFAVAFTDYENARTLREQAFQISQAFDYLSGACEVDNKVEMDRISLLTMLSIESYLKQTSLIAVHMDGFQRWKSNYVHAYRKAHRAHHEALAELGKSFDALRPRARALDRMNTIVELGPPLIAAMHAGADLLKLETALCACPDAMEAAVDQTSPLCPRCRWTPNDSLPHQQLKRLQAKVEAGLADRFQRFKDATIAAILKKAADEKNTSLKELLQIVQVADSDKLANVLTDDLIAFLRKLLFDENLVHEEVALEPIIQHVGAIEEDRVDESIALFTKLLNKAVKDAKDKHGKGKRVRVFLRFYDNTGGVV